MEDAIFGYLLGVSFQISKFPFRVVIGVVETPEVMEESHHFSLRTLRARLISLLLRDLRRRGVGLLGGGVPEIDLVSIFWVNV